MGTRGADALAAGLGITRRLELASHCVSRDAYDEAAFQDLLDENLSLTECARRGAARLRSFPALLSDVFCLLFKLRPALLDRTLVRPAFQVNRYLIARLAVDPGVKELRCGTVLDEEAAGAVAFELARRLLGELAANDFDDENVLLELEEGIGESGRTGKSHPLGCPPSGARSRARGAGEGEGARGERLPYDLQQRLEMVEALRSFRNLDRLLALARALTSKLASDDPLRWEAAEVYDIGLGNELSRLLPSELLALQAAPRRKDFLRRLLGRQLLTYQIRGREHGGPMVILADVSQSMAGEKELVAKALALALAQTAAERGQRASLVLFGPRTTPVCRFDFQPGGPRRQQVVAVAETFLGGGTDFERPVATALDLVARRREVGGQVILISDGLCEVRPEWLSRIRAVKARRQIHIASFVVDIDPWSDKSAALFSDRIVRWSQLR